LANFVAGWRAVRGTTYFLQCAPGDIRRAGASNLLAARRSQGLVSHNPLSVAAGPRLDVSASWAALSHYVASVSGRTAGAAFALPQRLTQRRALSTMAQACNTSCEEAR